MSVTDQPNTQTDRIEERIKEVPGDRRTPDRDQAAREILEWQQGGEWPLSGREMAERGDARDEE